MIPTLYDYDEDDEKTPTAPIAGSATFIFKQTYMPLFTSATWIAQAGVRYLSGVEEIFFESSEKSATLSDAEVLQWSRAVLRTNADYFRMKGVDVNKAYVEIGGRIEDL